MKMTFQTPLGTFTSKDVEGARENDEVREFLTEILAGEATASMDTEDGRRVYFGRETLRNSVVTIS